MTRDFLELGYDGDAAATSVLGFSFMNTPVFEPTWCTEKFRFVDYKGKPTVLRAPSWFILISTISRFKKLLLERCASPAK